MRYELSDLECAVIKPKLSNKPRGVPHVNDRRVLNGIFWVLRSGAPWRDLPESYGPYHDIHNTFLDYQTPTPALPAASRRSQARPHKGEGENVGSV